MAGTNGLTLIGRAFEFNPNKSGISAATKGRARWSFEYNYFWLFYIQLPNAPPLALLGTASYLTVKVLLLH